jgi:hypothetical protein
MKNVEGKSRQSHFNIHYFDIKSGLLFWRFFSQKRKDPFSRILPKVFFDSLRLALPGSGSMGIFSAVLRHPGKKSSELYIRKNVPAEY